MALRRPEIFSKCVAFRRRLSVALFALFFVLTLLLLVAPTILSSNLAQNYLKETLSTALHAPVKWSTLQLSWRRGLQLRNLTIGPASGSRQQARLAEIDCRPGFGFGAKPGESFGLDLFLRFHDLQLELAPPVAPTSAMPSPQPTEEKLDPLTALAQGLERFALLSWPLPVDLRVDVAVAPFTLTYHDPRSGRGLRFAGGQMQVKIPSLEQAALTINLSGKVEVDEQPLGELRLATEIAGLVAPSGRIVPAGALFSAFVDFPGLVLKAAGRLDQGPGLESELRLDLSRLQKVAAPFLPADLPVLGGTLLATLQAQVDTEKNLTLRSNLTGEDLSGATAGPLSFTLGQQIGIDHRRQVVTFDQGFLTVPQLLQADWEASVEKPGSPQRHVFARLQQLDVDLDRMLTLAQPFLPPGLPQLQGGRLQLHDLYLQLRGAPGEGELRLAKGALLLQSLRRGELAVSGIDLAVTDLTIPLRASFPASIAAELKWDIATIDLRGAPSLAVTGVVGNGKLAIDSIRKAAGQEKFSANGSFDHQLRVRSLEVVGLTRLSTLANDLHLAFALLEEGGISVETFKLETDIAALTATVAGKELLPLALRQELQVAGGELRPGESLPQVKSIAFSISSPTLFNVSGAGSLAAERLLTLATQSRFELPRLIAVAGPLLPEKLTASGSISSALQLVATIPDRPLPAGQAPLRSAKNALALLQELSGRLHLAGVELRLPLANGNLHLSGISTPQPFSLRSARHGAEIDLGGAITFDLCAGSVINGKVLPVEHGRMTFSGELRDWNRAFLAETVQIDPLGVKQRSELTISGFSSLLDQPLPPPSATLLQRLDATLFSEIDINLHPDALQLLPDLVVSGKTAAGSRIDLRGGESLRLHAYAAVDDLDVVIANGPQLFGLQAHFNLDRTLQISSAPTRKVRWLPLSTSLVQPSPQPLPAPLAGARQRLHDDLRGNSNGKRSLTIQSLTLPSLPLPLTIAALEAEITTGEEEAGMNFLQAELLGGTLRARALLDLRLPLPVLGAEVLFTNLDLSRLGSGVTEPQPGGVESSISGEVFLRLPLLGERRALLEGLTLSGRLRTIGAKSFDRALASLDPYERNEAIMGQRKLLRLGQLQGVEVSASDGALSLSGAVTSQGISLALPKIDRLRLADLSLHKELAPVLTAINAVRPPLEFLRANTIAIGAQGEISLRQEEK